ncbi:hypothetical protein ACFY2M_19225 [Streptomyces sp. NPDC001276]|uniref:hypothetical protein n=1 Tax=Streptomyces sp. NPDC001276 TaxID=3364555 RepID=UPI0036B92ECE
MPDVTVKLSDGVREITVEISGADDDPLMRAEDAAVRLYGIAAGPPDRRAGFAGWAVSSDTERGHEE